MPRQRLFQRPDKRRGAMAVLIALLLVVFLVAVVLSVDVAYMQLTRTKLGTATDAAARAAGEALSRTQSIAAAQQAAKDVAAANQVASAPLKLDDADITFGRSLRQTDGSWIFTAGAAPANSVRITGRRTQGSASGPVSLFFGGLLGRSTFEPTQEATVVQMDRDIILVVDRSSSMKLSVSETAPTISTSDPRFCQLADAQSRWAALGVSVDEFTDVLNETVYSEYVGLVSYASSGTWCGISNNTADIDQQLNANEDLVDSAMASLSAKIWNGGTNITAGINLGRIALLDTTVGRPFAAKTMVLFTDGHATDGGSPLSAAQAAAAQDIVIHTITLGAGANQDDMQEVAEVTSGRHFHANSEAELLETFREIAYSLPVVLTE